MFSILKEASGAPKNIVSKLSEASRSLVDQSKVSADSFALAAHHETRRSELVHIGVKPTNSSSLALSYTLHTGLASRMET